MAETSNGDIRQLAEWLKALAEPKRLSILNLLLAGVHCNCELVEQLDMTPSLISHHLRALREVGLVAMERDAVDSRWIYYSVDEAVLRELNRAFGLFFDPARIQPRRPSCGPQGAITRLTDIPVNA